MTTTRTDAHRPSAADFDPEQYTCLGVFDLKPFDGFDGATLEERQDRHNLIQSMREQGYRFAEHVGQSHQCGHCGAHIRYAALMAREDIHELIYIGETCLTNRFEELTKAQFDALRKAAQLDREKMAKLAAFNEFLANHSELVPATYARNLVGDDSEKYGTGWATSVIADILAKLRQYGSISEKQIAFVVKLIAEVEEKIASYTEPIAAGPAPRGKQVIEGVIVGFKTTEGYMPGTSVTKMMVELDNGSKAYGTCPESLSNADKGDRIQFSATFEAPRDGAEDMSFFKRPTKAVIV